MTKSLKDIDNKSKLDQNIDNLIIFGNKLSSLSQIAWRSAVLSQCIAFGIVMINPLESIMIESLSSYGKILVSLSPMTPMIFTLINHETIFQQIQNDINKSNTTIK